jgi:hypothetical protein
LYRYITVTKAVIEAMGGELTYAPPPEDDTLGDVYAFSVPLLRSPRDESSFDFDFIPSLPTPTYARVAAVLHPALSASFKVRKVKNPNLNLNSHSTPPGD